MIKQKQKTSKEKTIVLTILFFSILLLSSLSLALPTGPSGITYGENTTGATTAAQMVNISGGYISKFNLTVSSQNPHWKAFVGNMDGKFTLDDSSGSTIYDWSLATTDGEVYATRTSTAIDWVGIGCASSAEIIAEDTALEHYGEDNISSTFTSASNLETFLTAGIQIAPTTCYATNTYNSTGASLDFEEVILASAASEIIFTTILEQDADGYDDGLYDFQMIVPENANETKQLTTAYYLYVELG